MAATLTNWKYYIIEPELAVNLFTDPSFEVGVTNCSGVGTIAQSSEQARRGKYSAKVTPGAASSDAYIYSSLTLTSGLEYTFSADVYVAAGITFTIGIAPSGATASALETYIGNGHWQRASVTLSAATATALHDFIIDRPADQASVTAFYTDGWLAKTGDDNNYFDGDSVDKYLDTPQFYWNGARNASTSTRLASTRAGGTLLDISDYCRVRQVMGLGMTGMVTNTSGLALGGEMYQNSHANARVFQLICRADIGSTAAYGTLQRKLARLEKAMNPKRMKTDQPLRLMIVGFDDSGIEASDRVIIDCAYEGGLEGALTGRHPEFPITFRQFDALIPADGYVCTSLQASTSVDGGADGSLLIINQDTGLTTALVGFGGAVYGITPDSSGGLYLWGNFLNYGDANGDNIVYRNSAGTISSLGTGSPSGSVMDAIFGIDGSLYVAGGENMGGVAAADYIGKWSGTAWSALGSGFNASCLALAADNSGNIYAGGTFASSGATTLNGIGKWNGTAWSALGSGTVGVTGTVSSLACLPDNRIVLAGSYSGAGGTAGLDYLSVYDPSTNAFSALGSAPNAQVSKVLYNRAQGVLYAFGDFGTIGGISSNYAAYWDGVNWRPMAGAQSSITGIHYAAIVNGAVHANAEYWNTGIIQTSGTAVWNGATWRAVECKSDSGLYALASAPANNLLICSYNSGGSVTYTIPAVSTITNSTEGNIYPSVTFDACGSYVYSLWNRTTGERIYLNGLTVGAGERIELVFSPTGYTMTSNVRGDMRSSVLSGSSPTFHLQPGANYVSVFVYPSPVTGVTVPLKYPAAGYISLNETVYE